MHTACQSSIINENGIVSMDAVVPGISTELKQTEWYVFVSFASLNTFSMFGLGQQIGQYMLISADAYHVVINYVSVQKLAITWMTIVAWACVCIWY